MRCRALGVVPDLNGGPLRDHTSEQPNEFGAQHEYFRPSLVLVCLMTELIQMAPLIKNSFYLLDACHLFIPATAFINSPSVSVSVTACAPARARVDKLADEWSLAFCFLRSPSSR